MSEQLENIDDKFSKLFGAIKFDPTKNNLEEKPEEEDLKKAYKFTDGETLVRLVPFEDGSVIKVVDVHMNLGVPFLCPNKLDRNVDCPSCKLGWDIYNKNGKKHTDDSKNYLSQEKWFVRGIVRSKEKEDIEKYGHPVLRFMEFTPTVGKKILSYFSDKEIEESGDITDFQLGRDLKIKKDEVKAKARQASIEIDRSMSQKPLFTGVKVNSEDFKKYFVLMLEKAVDSQERYSKKSPVEVLELLERHLDRLKKKNKDSSTDEEEVSKPSFEDESSDFKQKMKSLEEDAETEFKKFVEGL